MALARRERLVEVLNHAPLNEYNQGIWQILQRPVATVNDQTQKVLDAANFLAADPSFLAPRHHLLYLDWFSDIFQALVHAKVFHHYRVETPQGTVTKFEHVDDPGLRAAIWQFFRVSARSDLHVSVFIERMCDQNVQFNELFQRSNEEFRLYTLQEVAQKCYGGDVATFAQNFIRGYGIDPPKLYHERGEAVALMAWGVHAGRAVTAWNKYTETVDSLTEDKKRQICKELTRLQAPPKDPLMLFIQKYAADAMEGYWIHRSLQFTHIQPQNFQTV